MKRRKDVFTMGEVANICRVSVRTVTRWFDSGYLKGYRIPGRQERRVFLEDLVRFLKDRGIPLRELKDYVQYKVLIAVADSTFDRLLRESLSKIEGCEFRFASSAFEAGVLMVGIRPNAIVIDFSLGRREAIEIASNLRKDDTYATALIIGLASEDEAEPERLLQYGFNVVFKKPLDVAVIAKRIEIEKEAQR